MFLVGNCSTPAKRLIRITQECLYRAIAIVKPGAKLGDIGAIIQQHAETNRLSVVREYCGYGIGTDYHEESLQILNYGTAGTGTILESGMTFTITPMLNIGKRHTQLLPDQFTVITKDRSLSAQWMHTILVTESGAEILTKRQEETISC
jgi:methionyl aminopeptidase